MSGTIKCGIIGAGIMGRRQALELQEAWFRPYAEVVGVYDNDEQKLAEVAALVGATAYPTIEKLLESGVDAVYVATPDNAHMEPFVKAVDAGVAVLVEKPLATTAADARQMVAAAERARRPVEVNWGNRWLPPFLSLKEAIEANSLGEVRTIKSWLSNTKMVPLSMLKWSGESTCAWFLLSHVFDLSTWLTGYRPRSVYARSVKKTLVSLGCDTPDYFSALVEYDHGASGLYESAWILPDGLGRIVDFQYHVIGSEGSSSIDLGHQMSAITGTQRTDWPRKVSYSRDRMMSFLQNVEQNRVDVDSFRSGFDNTATLVALHSSAASGKVETVEQL